MFHDWGWIETLSREQSRRWTAWRASVQNLVIIELGAGMYIPSVRLFSEDAAHHGTLIRINPREPDRPRRTTGVSLPVGALAGMEAIGDALFDTGFWDGA